MIVLFMILYAGLFDKYALNWQGGPRREVIKHLAATGQLIATEDEIV